MELNIQAIADEKIKAMHESGQIKEQIESSLEKVILKAVDDAIDGYKIRRDIQEEVEKSVSTLAAQLNFAAYNTFISAKVKEIMETVLAEDLTSKIQSVFDNIFIDKKENIELSEIFEFYRDWLIETLDDQEKYDLDNCFNAEYGENDEYHWLDIKLSKEKKDRYSRSDDDCFETTIHKNKDGTGYIGRCYLAGEDLGKGVTFKHLNKFEIFILNILYNKTPIIIDVEDEDDIDNCLGLDM